MAYDKKTWESGEVIETTELQHIEDGIEANSYQIGYVADGLAAEYEARVYEKDEICRNEGVVYKAKQRIDPAESFNPSHWDAVHLGDMITYNQVADLNSAVRNFDLLFPTLAMTLESGNLTDGGAQSSANTRIRTKSGTIKRAVQGDFVYCDESYRCCVGIYNSYTLTTANFVAWVNDFRSGLIFIPQQYIGKYVALRIQKVGHEADNISDDVATIADHVKYFSPYEVLDFLHALTGTDDLDGAKERGVYRWTSDSVPANAPDDSAGIMLVLSGGDTKHNHLSAQIVIAANGTEYIRYITSGGTTTGWKQQAKKTEVDALMEKGMLTNTDDLDTVLTNGNYYWTSASVPANAPVKGGMMIVGNPKTAISNYKAQIVIANSELIYRYKASAGWQAWERVAGEQTPNLYDESQMADSSKVSVTHNSNGTITLTTKEISTHAYVQILGESDIEENAIYQLHFRVISCTATDGNGDPATPKIALRFIGNAKSETALAGGILTAVAPGEYAAAVYTSGYEKALRLYITTSPAANSTVVIRDVMVAKHPFPLPFTPYGRTIQDLTARGMAASAHNRTWGKSNFQAMARQFCTVKYTPLAKIPCQFDTQSVTNFPANQEAMGVPYSSARGNDRLIGMHISLYTFLSAVHNPRSVVYKRQLTYNNAMTYYGCVCSAFVNYALGADINLTTEELFGWDKLTPIKFQALDVGDVLLISGHVKIVYDVTRDEWGRIIGITIAEAGEPVVKATTYTWQSFLNASGSYVARRYADIDGVPYTLQPMVRGYLDETPQEITYPDIMTEYGDQVAILAGEDIKINVIDSTGYSSIEVWKDGSKTEDISTLADFTLENAAAGTYEIKMLGTGKATSTKFIVVQATCSYNTSTHVLTFSSENATPHAVLTYTAYPTNHYVNLTAAQLASGSADLTGHVGMQDAHNQTYQYAKVNFMTDYGVATWYSHDLHQWEEVG